MSESLPHGEKEAGKWELIRGTPKDRADLIYLAKAEIGEEEEELYPLPDDMEFPEGCGMILRKGAEPIGFVFFEMHEHEGDQILFVQGIFVQPNERNAGVTGKLITRLREEAERMGATHVSWVAGSSIMERLSEKIADNEFAQIIPIEQLDRSFLTKRYNSIS